ncbi:MULTISPECIES: hypothetical protein [Curtobacterium]|uniref:hypothetical protein n=1 Tax=Curtobacterium TaxID=2034 RepID=UPI00112E2705|nr:hypothetical protein [Curtobacterium flaccumfaciens]MCS6577464.1 hypothetical protein [Curtobacterium flaccumfaciens]MDQ0540878.1 hypothetical protein [Curtobacterium flaccumfaciens]WNY33267.1 hypothetical protein Q9Q99_14070 [Curtobacterium flaccumfaciens]
MKLVGVISTFLAAGAIVASVAAPANAAASYEVQINPVKAGSTACPLPFACSFQYLKSITFYSRASAQMKGISTHAKAKQPGTNKVLFDATKGSKSSNINSVSFKVPSEYKNTLIDASMTSKFTPKSGSVVTKSTSKRIVTPVG